MRRNLECSRQAAAVACATRPESRGIVSGGPPSKAGAPNERAYLHQVGRAAAVQPLLPRACCCLRQLRREVVPGRPMHCMQQRSQLACNQTEAGPLHLTFYIALSNRREVSPTYLQTVGQHKWCCKARACVAGCGAAAPLRFGAQVISPCCRKCHYLLVPCRVCRCVGRWAEQSFN